MSIAVDLDGTLAEYHGGQADEGIGPPVPLMLERVKCWLVEGKTVKIFTARVGPRGVGGIEEKEFVDKQYVLIRAWLTQYLGTAGSVMEITASKDFSIEEIWDDRAYRVKKNTGLLEFPR